MKKTKYADPLPGPKIIKKIQLPEAKRRFPGDTLVEQIINCTNSIDDHVLFEKARSYAKNSLSKFKSDTSRKALNFLRTKKFFIEHGEDFYTSFTVNPVRDGKGGFDISYVHLIGMYTDKGYIYVTYNKLKRTSCFTAHVFDRVVQRCGLPNRKDAIKEFLSYIGSSSDIEYNKINTDETAINFSLGALLGNIINKDPEIALYKTFINKDMINSDQQPWMT